jgi:hypothetical protein
MADTNTSNDVSWERKPRKAGSGDHRSSRHHRRRHSGGSRLLNKMGGARVRR